MIVEGMIGIGGTIEEMIEVIGMIEGIGKMIEEMIGVDATIAVMIAMMTAVKTHEKKDVMIGATIATTIDEMIGVTIDAMIVMTTAMKIVRANKLINQNVQSRT